MKNLLNSLCFAFVLITSVFTSSFCQAQKDMGRWHRVSRVLDGDTIKLDNGTHVRLIGIDAPEMESNAKLTRDLRERHLTVSQELEMGRKSYQFTKQLVEGKKIYLEFDRLKYDKYHRILAYVFLTNHQFVNAEIVKAGYAYPYTIKPDVKYSSLFRQLYKEAKENHRGLWNTDRVSKKHFKWF
ncbi:MAG: thermonuclease family protein [Candidatus Omnitrophica bacterium]|nr:thermonuclease family protein [Candidatus Omnitrophota bacterium]